MKTQYQMGVSVMNYLQGLGINMITIGKAIEDKSLEQSYRLITENPQITKEEFLREMQIEEWEDYRLILKKQKTLSV